MSDPTMVSLVLLSFRRFEATTGPCLQTLSPALGDARFELILVDNASEDGSAAQCANYAADHPAVQYLPQQHNLGFSGGMNAGVAAAKGEWVCLVNSDTLFPVGALDCLFTTLVNAPPDVASVGPVTNAAGNGQRLCLPGLDFDQILALGASAMAAPTGLLAPTYRSDFFCVAVRRAVWHELGGLDPVFGLGYYEDFDFSLRLARTGRRQVIAEDVFVAHVGSASFAGLGAQQRELMRRNRALLLARHQQVRFDAARLGNAEALRHLLARAQVSGWTDALRQRAAWRFAAMLWDEPRSPFKRLRWRWSTRDIRRALLQAGITAQFPTAPPSAAVATTVAAAGR